jgi:outer membrane protein TolC
LDILSIVIRRCKKEYNLRHLLILICSLGLPGCISYSNIHGNSQKLDANNLSHSHIYKISHVTTIPNHDKWWTKFHDSQLNELVSVAIQDAPDMRIAETRIRQARYVAEETRALLWPSIDLSGYAQRQHFPEFGLTPPPFNGIT